MDQLVLVLVILIATVLAEPLSERLGIASSVLMTVLGCVLALIPAVPTLDIPPDLILPLVLPPLLYAAARRSSWRQYAESWLPIVLRAVGLVVVTAAAIAAVFHSWHPGFGIAVGVVLGALVAPPDPVAAMTMASKLGLPRRLTVALGGEGLFNDVTAIVIYVVAIQAVVTGMFSPWEAAGDFAIAMVVGGSAGMALGWLGVRFTQYLDNSIWQVAFTLLLPFAAYGLAERFEGSAVLAVLVCALYLTDAVTEIGDRTFRLVSDSVWEIAELLVTGFAFALIGLELRTVLRAAGPDWLSLTGVSAAVIATVVALRLGWLLATWALGNKLGDPDEEDVFTWQEVVVTWWAGMRGVVTVALGLAVPFTTESASPFPGRSEVLFVAFSVVLFTLLIQGPTLPLVVRWTGVSADTQQERRLERELWTRVAAAQLMQLKAITQRDDLPEDVYDNLRDRLQRRIADADPAAAESGAKANAESERRLHAQLKRDWREVMEAGRSEAQAARREPGMPADIVDRVTRRLDLG